MKNECCRKTIKQIEDWFKERTSVQEGRPNLVRFMSFEWVEFKSELIGEKIKKNGM